MYKKQSLINQYNSMSPSCSRERRLGAQPNWLAQLQVTYRKGKSRIPLSVQSYFVPELKLSTVSDV